MSTSLVGANACGARRFVSTVGSCVDGACLHAEKRRTCFSLRGGFLRVFLHVDQSAWGGTLVNSLLCAYGLLHRHWSKRVKRRSPHGILKIDACR